MKLTILKKHSLIVLVAAANYGYAEDYQLEASIGFSDGDVDVGNLSGDIESIDLEFTANFSKVDTSKGPLAEAEFLDRSSNFSLTSSDGEVEDVDFDELAGNLRLVDKESGLTAELYLSDGEAAGVDSEAFGISLGYYAAENTEVAIGYLNAEVGSEDSDTIFVGVKHVSTGEVAFTVEGVLGSLDTDAGDDTLLNLSGTIYPTPQLGIGASFTTVDSDVDNDAFELFADWFVTPVAAITISYADSEVGAVETDILSVIGRLRF